MAILVFKMLSPDNENYLDDHLEDLNNLVNLEEIHSETYQNKIEDFNNLLPNFLRETFSETQQCKTELNKIQEKNHKKKEESINKFINNKTRKQYYTEQYPDIFEGKKNKIDEIHTRKFGDDNILSKANCHFINFLASYINFILNFFDIEEKFVKIDYSKYKKKINKKIFLVLKNSTIGQILSGEISPKFRTLIKNKNMNYLLYIKIINKILSEKYIDLFRNVYYKNERIINLKKYDNNIQIGNIILPKTEVKMFEDFLNKERKKGSEKYIEKVKKVVFNKFIIDDN